MLDTLPLLKSIAHPCLYAEFDACFVHIALRWQIRHIKIIGRIIWNARIRRLLTFGRRALSRIVVSRLYPPPKRAFTIVFTTTLCPRYVFSDCS